MGKETGFLEYKRMDNPRRSEEIRIKDFKEMYESIDDDSRKKQAAICMNCGVPFCQSGMTLSGMGTGCPLHNLIPEWNDELYHGNIKNAYERLMKTNPFPEFTGRVCPALCEKACMCGQYDTAVTIHDNEKYIIEKAFEKGIVKPYSSPKKSKKKVAVVGSGPAGLSVAYTLSHRGHEVSVYEREDKPGGLLMYGIPNMKLDKSVIERRIALMQEEGVRFLCGVNIGVDVKKEELLSEYDAVILCCGAKEPRRLAGINPEETKGVYFAVDFLTSTTKALLNSNKVDLSSAKKNSYISAKNKNVVIVGGGDTGNDCIATAVRHGAKSVTALEMMPKPPENRTADNPWPEWPKVLKTDYGHQEAAMVFGKDIRIFETTVKSVNTDDKGHIKSIETVEVYFEKGKLNFKEGSEKTIPCDLLLIAAGFIGCEEYVAKSFDIELSDRHTVKGKNNDHHISDKIFSAGDARTGQSLVVRAIAEGIECAKEADEYLMGYTI